MGALKAIASLAFKAAPLLWSGLKKVFGFLTAQRSIIGMLFSGLVLCLAGQAWASVLMFAKAAFLLFAAAFGFHLTTHGVQVTMQPLMSPAPPLPRSGE